MMDVTMRPASAGDLPAILRLLADDPLGKTREAAVEAPYLAAFAAIAADPNHEVVVLSPLFRSEKRGDRFYARLGFFASHEGMKLEL
jgi:hypothetical protein